MLNNPLECQIGLIYNMAIPAAPGNHAADFIDSPAERTDPMMALSFRQYCLLEPVMEIARYHLYEQIQFITFIINLAVLTESKAGFDFINRSLNGTPLIIIVEDLCCCKVINVCYDCLVFVSAFIEYKLAILCFCRKGLSDNDDSPRPCPSGHWQAYIGCMEHGMLIYAFISLLPLVVSRVLTDPFDDLVHV